MFSRRSKLDRAEAHLAEAKRLALEHIQAEVDGVPPSLATAVASIARAQHWLAMGRSHIGQV